MGIDEPQRVASGVHQLGVASILAINVSPMTDHSLGHVKNFPTFPRHLHVLRRQNNVAFLTSHRGRPVRYPAPSQTPTSAP